MKIILTDEYKSLKPFQSEELNDFTVITGKNGSGKSQLLYLIGKKSQNDPSVISIRVEVQPNITRIQAEGIVKENSTQIGHEHWKKIVQQQLTNFNQLSLSARNLITYIIENNLQSNINRQGRNTLVTNEIEYKELIAKLNSEINNTPLINLDQVAYHIERRVLRKIFNPKNEGLFRFVKELCNYTGKKEAELTDADFYNTPIEEHLIDSNDLFSSQVELIFYNYAKRRDLNRKSYFYKKEEGEENNSISDEEFIKKFIPPWDLINDILTTHSVDFYFTGIEKRDFTTETQIDFKLYKKSINQPIPFNDLSSGEKVIIGLILKLFTSKYYGDGMSFPDLLILDEPDAHLHPEMSKLLLDVLEETFVKKFQIKVILTTHSPSTIALTPESSIYELSNGVNSYLKKISKDDALKILTSFIPTLSIDYKNHKQVFVESPTDVMYYQSIHDKHHQNKKLPYKLYFISNTAGKSNCSQVYKITEDIRKSGNTTSFGIVDWDLTNKPASFLFVHGLNERYSVENFILDPIYILCLLVDMKNAHNICESIGIDQTYNQYLIGNEPQERLQEIVSFFFEEFEKKFPSFKYSDNKTAIEYLNGKKLEVPNWYLTMQGHEIVDKVKVIFPALNKYTSEGELQNAITIILTKCYPFVPLTTIQTIENI